MSLQLLTWMRPLAGRFAPALVLVVLAGCSLAPRYTRPDVAVPEHLDETQAQSTNAHACHAQLQQADLAFVNAVSSRQALRDLVTTALCRNADYRLAELNVGLARAQSRLDSIARLPHIDGQIAGTRQRFSDTSLDERYQQVLSTATVSLSAFDPDFFGALRSQAEAEAWRLDASEHGRDAARAALIAETLRAYALYSAALESEAQFAAVHQSVRTQLALARRRLSLGVISVEEFRHWETEAAQAEASAGQAAANSASAERALGLLVGLDYPLPAPMLADLTEEGDQDTGYAGVHSAVLLMRPEVLEAESRLRAAHADIGVARAAFFPSIQLSTAIGSASNDLGALFSSARVWNFSPRLSVPIFDFGRNRRGLDLAWLRQQQGIVEYESALQRAFVDVADALGERTKARLAYSASLKNQVRSRQALEALERRVSAGLQDPAESPQAQIQAANAAIDCIASQQQLAIARIALSHAFYNTTAATRPPSDSN